MFKIPGKAYSKVITDRVEVSEKVEVCGVDFRIKNYVKKIQGEEKGIFYFFHGPAGGESKNV